MSKNIKDPCGRVQVPLLIKPVGFSHFLFGSVHLVQQVAFWIQPSNIPGTETTSELTIRNVSLTTIGVMLEH